MTVTGGTLRDELLGSTDRAAWLSRPELAEARIVRMMRAAIGIAFGDGS